MDIKVFDLEFETNHYYLKHPSIVNQIKFDNRTFYAKFERIDEPLNELIVKQHLDKEFVFAVPLLQNNLTNYLVLEYKGNEYIRFYHLVKYLFVSLEIENYHIYQGKVEDKIQVFIEVDSLSLEEAHSRLEEISNALEQKLSKKWKLLPSISLPIEYNIVTLPYKRVDTSPR